MNEWKDVSTAPREEKEILVSDGENIAIGSYVKYKDKFYPAHHDDNLWWNITHWMPLPSLEPIKKKHYCSLDPLRRDNAIHCTDDLNDPGLIVSTQTGWFKVNFCPFCGAKADTTINKS